jgi:hypothetical protein
VEGALHALLVGVGIGEGFIWIDLFMEAEKKVSYVTSRVPGIPRAFLRCGVCDEQLIGCGRETIATDSAINMHN